MEETKETGLKTKDITFLYKDAGFNFRVAAFVKCGDYMLLQKSEGADFWNLVGGRVKLGESTEEAIERELLEELGIESDKELIWIAENFFMWQGHHAHEMLYIFKVELDESCFDKFENFKVIDSQDEYTKWVHKDDVNNYVCKPNLLYEIWNKSDRFNHTVNRDY